MCLALQTSSDNTRTYFCYLIMYIIVGMFVVIYRQSMLSIALKCFTLMLTKPGDQKFDEFCTDSAKCLC